MMLNNRPKVFFELITDCNECAWNPKFQKTPFEQGWEEQNCKKCINACSKSNK
jgi:hypothetical protein